MDTTVQARRPAPTRVSSRRRHWWRSRTFLGIAYAAPTALIVAVFFLVPLGLLVWMSLHRWPLIGDPTLNAPDNYTQIQDNQLFIDSVWFTVKYTVIITILLTAIALGLGLLVQERRRGVGFFRTAYFLPGAVGFAAASLLFVGFLRSPIGPIDPLLQRLGLIDEPISWLGSPNMALSSTIMLVLWRFAGFFMLILLVGLQSIPTDVYEAARVDGANRWQVFSRITLPLLRPTLALVLVLSVTGSLVAFDQFFIFTGGRPDNSTVSMIMVIYQQGFTRFDLGGAAALSVVVLVALLILNTIQLRVLRREK